MPLRLSVLMVRRMKLAATPLIFTALLLTAFSAHTQIAIIEYKFNDSGTTTVSTGSDTTALRLFASNGTTATDYHGAAGTGVSGAAGDLALNFTSATGMGNAGTGPVANQAADNNNIDALRSLTLSGWFKTESTTAIGNSARLFQNASSGNGFSLLASTSGNLQVSLGNGSSTNFVTTTNSYSATQSWVFFAVTYDGMVAANNVKFYVGSASSGVSLAQTFSYAGGLLGNDSLPLSVGNESVGGTNNRPFDGFLDNLRIFGATGGSSAGALSLSQLEAFRLGDITAVPEPAAYAGIGVLLGAIALRRRLRSRQVS